MDGEVSIWMRVRAYGWGGEHMDGEVSIWMGR